MSVTLGCDDASSFRSGPGSEMQTANLNRCVSDVSAVRAKISRGFFSLPSFFHLYIKSGFGINKISSRMATSKSIFEIYFLVDHVKLVSVSLVNIN